MSCSNHSCFADLSLAALMCVFVKNLCSSAKGVEKYILHAKLFVQDLCCALKRAIMY